MNSDYSQYKHPCKTCGEVGYWHDPSVWPEEEPICASYQPEPIDRSCPQCGLGVNSWWTNEQCPNHFLPSEYGGGCEGVLEAVESA